MTRVDYLVNTVVYMCIACAAQNSGYFLCPSLFLSSIKHVPFCFLLRRDGKSFLKDLPNWKHYILLLIKTIATKSRTSVDMDGILNFDCYRLKVSKFWKQIMVPKLLPKNKPSSLSWKITTSRLIQKRVYLLAKRT